MSVLIMAGGEAKRYRGYCKQLLPVFGTPVLGRILRQVRELWEEEPTVVTRNPEILVYARKTYPSVPGELVQGILGVQEIWSDYTTILLGDVLYTPRTMLGIFRGNKELNWFGNGHEVYAFSFSHRYWDVLKSYMRDTPFPWRLGTLYRQYHGLLEDKRSNPQIRRDHFTWIYDATRDIDYPENYDLVVAGKDYWSGSCKV